jgi:quercetin dioxygenase-like cupin family protein
MVVAKRTKWEGTEPPTEASLRALMGSEGLRPYSWSNGPGDVYAPHKHDYDKVIYVVSGSITFGLPAEKREMQMQAGDRLDLPAGMVHAARVGAEGVVCLEAHG